MSQEFLLYSLAENLSVDIDIVRTWPMKKVLGWKNYFERKNTLIKEHLASPSSSAGDGGVHVRKAGGRLVMDYFLFFFKIN